MRYRNSIGETNAQNKLDNLDYKSLKTNMPVIGLFDVETLPIEAYAWSLYKVDIYQEQIKKPTGLLSWAGKFLNQPDVYSDILTPEEAVDRNEERITKSCWEFLSKCDIVVGHNLIDFDRKTINTYILKYGLPPLHYKMVDTLKLVRANVRLDSNKMKFVNDYLGIRTKIENEGFPLWRACSDGDPEALATMLEYNEGDIFALEDLYYKVRPYFRYFNAALYNTIEERQCPVCGCMELDKQDKFYMTPAGKWYSYRCTECGCLSRGKENLLSKHKRKLLLNPIS